MYQITEYTKKKAKQLGVIVEPSENKNKKIDVYKDKKKIASVGSIGYMDYPNFIKEKGLDYANKRRMAYKNRHNKDRKIVGSNGYWADRLLW